MSKPNKKISNRRTFLKKSAAGAALVSLPWSAKSYARIMGANDRMNFAIVGLHGRGKALLRAVLDSPNTQVGYLCDVDGRVFDGPEDTVKEAGGKKPKRMEDIRELLQQEDLDAIAIATPDHWHAPMAIMGAQAGKHVYVEKPCSHNPQEGEWLVQVQKDTGMVIQMGNQQRSAPTSIQAIEDISNGLIGKPYFGKCWYSNARGPIGTGQKTPVPEWLNWELWQGPAPRREYQDIWVHYNWHWFWDWGTGEVNNNGTHEIDICRWALGVDYPVKVCSNGGRYHYDDDWEFYDTQVVNYEFPGDKLITWEGKSCNPFEYYDRGRGATIHGTKGTILLDRNTYVLFDLKGNEVKRLNESERSATTDTVGAGSLDVRHMTNFLNAIRKGEKQNSPIDEGHISNLLCHLGNYSQYTGRTLFTNPKNGHILGDGAASQLWSRQYEPGWEPKV